jgi:hypothetical protein
MVEIKVVNDGTTTANSTQLAECIRKNAATRNFGA